MILNLNQRINLKKDSFFKSLLWWYSYYLNNHNFNHGEPMSLKRYYEWAGDNVVLFNCKYNR